MCVIVSRALRLVVLSGFPYQAQRHILSIAPPERLGLQAQERRQSSWKRWPQGMALAFEPAICQLHDP